MAIAWSVERSISLAKSTLAKECDETDKEAVKKLRTMLQGTANNIRGAIANGELDGDNEELNEQLTLLEDKQMLLQFGLRGFNKPASQPLITEEVDKEVRQLVAQACSALGMDAPRGYTQRMFNNDGFMLGMVKQVNTKSKIGTGGFVALAELGAIHLTAEYIVYQKAQEYGDQITKHLGKGCIERMEEVLLEHDAI